MRYDKVAQSIREPLSITAEVTSDLQRNPVPINPHDAHGAEQRLRGVLDLYLVVLADTEHSDVERCKQGLKAALDHLVETLNDVHWPEHNDWVDEDHDISEPDGQKFWRAPRPPASRRRAMSPLSKRLGAASRKSNKTGRSP